MLVEATEVSLQTEQPDTMNSAMCRFKVVFVPLSFRVWAPLFSDTGPLGPRPASKPCCPLQLL